MNAGPLCLKAPPFELFMVLSIGSASFCIVFLLFPLCFLLFVFVLFSIALFASLLLSFGSVYSFVDDAGLVIHRFA